jgi:hypothetical protein
VLIDRVNLSVLLTANTPGMNRLKIEDTKFVFYVLTIVAVVSHLLRTEEVPGLNLDRCQALMKKF